MKILLLVIDLLIISIQICSIRFIFLIYWWNTKHERRWITKEKWNVIIWITWRNNLYKRRTVEMNCLQRNHNQRKRFQNWSSRFLNDFNFYHFNLIKTHIKNNLRHKRRKWIKQTWAQTKQKLEFDWKNLKLDLKSILNSLELIYNFFSLHFILLLYTPSPLSYCLLLLLLLCVLFLAQHIRYVASNFCYIIISILFFAINLFLKAQIALRSWHLLRKLGCDGGKATFTFSFFFFFFLDENVWFFLMFNWNFGFFLLLPL